ncbi:MAG: Ku protein [Candidatus Aenigmatarchaeota archaeon]
MPRSIWKGSISFGLVNIPIKVYPAAQSKQLSFHTLCKEGHPLEYKRWCPVERREVKWDEVKKGYKIGDKYIILEKEDLKKIELKTTKTIDIVEFVDAPQIDPIYIEKSYYVVPEETGVKAYSLFVEALSLQNKIAIGKVVMREKEYLVALRAYKKGLVMHVLHYLGEIKPIEELEELKNVVVVKGEELKLAQVLIEKLTEEKFDIGKFTDTYTEALKKLIKTKAEGKVFKIEERPVEEAKSLMEALKISVETVERKKKKS